MKKLLRIYFISLVSLWATTKLLPAFSFDGELKTLLLGAIIFMVIHIFVLPIIKILFLPINLLTLGIFSWVTNVFALYLLTVYFPSFKIHPYHFQGLLTNGLSLPPMDLNILQVAIVTSFLLGLVSNFLRWLVKH